MSLCLCEIFLVLDQNTLRPLLQSILVFVCLMEQERGEGGAAPHIFKHHSQYFLPLKGAEITRYVSHPVLLFKSCFEVITN